MLCLCERTWSDSLAKLLPAHVGGLVSIGDGVGLGFDDLLELPLDTRGVCCTGALAPGCLLTLGEVGGETKGG